MERSNNPFHRSVSLSRRALLNASTAVLGLVAVCAAPVAVGGQAPDSLPADSTIAYRLDGLLVELLRSPLRANDAPFAIAALGRADLQGAKATASLDEMLEGLPGVEVQSRFNDAVGERISIRGFGSRAAFGVRGVRVLVDGIPATLADGQSTLDHLDLGSLGRVEALRGPASSLWGSAAGGVLVFESLRPPEQGVQQDARVVFGSDGYARLHSATSGRSGRTGWTVGAGLVQTDGFRQNPLDTESNYGGSRKLQLNGTLDFQGPRDRVRATFNALDMAAENPGSVADSAFRAGTHEARRFNVLQETRKDVGQAQVGLAWTRDLGNGRSFDLATYGILRDLDNPIPTVVIGLDRRAGGVTAEYRQEQLLTDDRLLRWRAGTQWDLQRDSRRTFDNDGGQAGAPELDQLERVRGLAIYGTALLSLSDRWILSGGLRYDRTRFSVADRLLANGDESGQRTMGAVSPSLGARFEHSRAFSLYGNLSTSFVTPTTTELANRADGQGGFNAEVDPTRALSAELGARGWLGSRLAYQVAAYRTWLSDELVPFEVPTQPGRRYYRNAGGSRYYGLETMVHGRLNRMFSGRVTYTYLHGTYHSFLTDTDDFTGNEIPGAAPHRFDVLLRAESGDGYIEARTEAAAAIAANDANTAETDAYTVVDLRAGLTSARARLGPASLLPFVGITNVFDRLYSSAVAVNAFGGRYFEPGPGRRFHVGVTAGLASN